MNILNEELIKNEEKTKEFLDNMKISIQSSIDLQNDYKLLFFNYIIRLIDLNTDNLTENDTNILIDLLYRLQKIFPSINEILAQLTTIKTTFDALTLPYNFDNIQNLFVKYSDLQHKIAIENSTLLDFLNYVSKFIVFHFSTNDVQIPNNSNIDVPSDTVNNISSNSTLDNIEPQQPKDVEKNTPEKNIVSKTTNENPLIENTLVISDIKQSVVLPYKISDLDHILETKKEYSNYNQIIRELYTIPYSNYKNSTISRFKEAFKLVRNKEHKSIKEALDLGVELLFNYNLHPAIISACKTTDELDIYLDYLETNETDKFDIFNIKYEVLPTLVKSK